MVVVEEPDHLTVRLPYFCSVHIYLVDGCLRFEPYFGFVPRTRSTVGKLFVFTSFTVAAFKAGVPYALGVAIIGIMLGIYDVIRTIATENVISRTAMVYAQLLHGERPSTPTRVLERGSMPMSVSPAPTTRDELRIRRDQQVKANEPGMDQ